MALQQTGLRPDLTQRLATGDVIILPTLEERREDIPHLVEVFLHRLKVEQQYDAELTSDAIAYLQKASWPGQIRELEATVRTVVAREVALQSLEGIEHRRTVITLEAVKAYLVATAGGLRGTGFRSHAQDDHVHRGSARARVRVLAQAARGSDPGGAPGSPREAPGQQDPGRPGAGHRGQYAQGPDEDVRASSDGPGRG